jgi:homoserine kinase type II
MAVYTEVSDEELSALVTSYGLGRLMSYKGIAEGVENTNYLVHTTAGSYILTLYEKRVAREDLPFFLGLMEHLAQRRVNCPTPLRDAKGRNVCELAGRAAAIVTFLEGYCVRRPEANHCADLGCALAGLHLAGQDFGMHRANDLGPTGWRPLFEKNAANADDVAPGLGMMISEELAEIDTRFPSGLPQGVIHADLFPDNVFFLNNKLSGLIDFYFACNDSLAYDIAICLNAWCFEKDHTFNVNKGRALLKAYDSVRVLSDAERAAMPMLARGAALRFLLTRSYDWLNRPASALVSPHDPSEYARRLRFHQSVRSIADYGMRAGS